MAEQGGNNNNVFSSREYRKGNWTQPETMILIEAKKMDDERRMKRNEEMNSTTKRSHHELRWKWVEDYCWKKGCHRSQNQCNDKWDNLMRDYKKIRDYESKIHHHNDHHNGSYWKLEKIQRKEKNLPSNLSFLVYEALVDVVERKIGGQRVVSGAAAVSGGCNSPSVGYLHSLPPLLQSHQIVMSSSSLPTSPILLPPPPSLPPPVGQPPLLFVPYFQALPIVDSDTSEHSDSPAKRRRRRGSGEGTSGGATTGTTSSDEISYAISKSASMIVKALKKSEEREEKRQRQVIRLHQKRLKIEEAKIEINRQGINGLVDAINNLANSILALASPSK